MVEMAITALGSLFGGSAAAGAGAAAAGTAAAGVGAAATGGFSLSTILQGATGLLGAFSAISAGNAQAEALQLQADDAAREVPLETLQGISRRSSIKSAMMQQLGEQDVAYAASGVDLSFGTPLAARKDAFREADLGTATAVGTEQTRVARLDEREVNYRRQASKAKKAGWLDAFGTMAKTATSISGRG